MENKTLKVHENLFEEGDLIQWTFEDNNTTPEIFRGKTFMSEVAVVDKRRGCYGVYAEYGQDFIPFKNADLVK
ncbi:hypothetical protein [Tenacibaculum aiptasiae]|uniref:hypothetical protein n=1 Tax=Tenacibaculum aiptasiae TaxID=426481 RepID=UPI00232F9A69|nr:hypothetical protein [Tenacibaculum aiptasiae]